MEKFKIETDRLIITEFDENMAEDVHINSLDEDIRKYVPDEVFETVAVARDTIMFLMDCYKGSEGPFVYPILSKSGENIGYVQAAPIDEEWEVGYHIASKYTQQGYASEALGAFVPIIMKQLGINHIWGITRGDNIASCKVLKKCAFTLHYKGTGKYLGENYELCKYLYGRADQFQYKRLDGTKEDVLFQIAKWHNLTPKLWLPDYKVSEKDISETINRINDTPKEDLFIEYALDSNDVVVGFIWAYRMVDKNKVMIMSIYVNEEYRNKGVAKTLKEKLEVWCRNERVDEIHTTVHYKNTNMIKLNEKLGYEPGMVSMVKRLVP